MPTKNEAGSAKQERLPKSESQAEHGGSSSSLRVYKEEQQELASLANAAEGYMARRDEIIGAPSEHFNRTIVDRYNTELAEMSERLKGLLDRMHEYRFAPPSKRWTESHQQELENTIEEATRILNKIEDANSDERRKGITKSLETKLHADVAEAMEESKEKRVEFTTRVKKAKASFAGKYKISYDKAVVLSQAPTSWLGRLADRLAGNKPLNSKEIELAKRLKTEEAQEDMRNLADLMEQAEEMWSQIHNVEKGSITTPDIMASVDTIRAVAEEQYVNASPEQRRRHADEMIEEIEQLSDYEDQVATADMAGEALDEEDRKALLPPPPTETTEEKTERAAEQPNKGVVEECIKAFGGGEEGRAEAGRLWDEIQGKINSAQKEVNFSALDYVQLMAKLRMAEIAKNPEKFDSLKRRLKKMNDVLGFDENQLPPPEAKTEKQEREQPLSIKWAARILTPEVAKKDWDETMALMSGGTLESSKTGAGVLRRETSSFIIQDLVSNLQSKLRDLTNLSEDYAALAKLEGTLAGEPPEATMVVMLKALEKVKPLNKDDEKARSEIQLTLGKIYESLTHVNATVETPTPSPKRPLPPGKEYEGADEMTSNIAQATAEAIKEDFDFEPVTLKEQPTLRTESEPAAVKEAVEELVNEASKTFKKNLTKDAAQSYKKALKRYLIADTEQKASEALAPLNALNRGYMRAGQATSFMAKVNQTRERLNQPE